MPIPQWALRKIIIIITFLAVYPQRFSYTVPWSDLLKGEDFQVEEELVTFGGSSSIINCKAGNILRLWWDSEPLYGIPYLGSYFQFIIILHSFGSHGHLSSLRLFLGIQNILVSKIGTGPCPWGGYMLEKREIIKNNTRKSTCKNSNVGRTNENRNRCVGPGGSGCGCGWAWMKSAKED